MDVKTGELLHQADVQGDPEAKAPNVIRQSVLPDILSIQNDTVWMRGLGVDKNLAPVADEPHLFAPRGFLDDTWWHRTYWVYGTEIGGGYTHWPDVGNAVPAGRLLVFDGGKHIYGYGRLRYRMGDGHVRPNATEDYRLFAEVLAPEPQTREDARGEERQAPAGREIKWTMQPALRGQVDRADSRCPAGRRWRVADRERRDSRPGHILGCFAGRRIKKVRLHAPCSAGAGRHGPDRFRRVRLHDRRDRHLPAIGLALKPPNTRCLSATENYMRSVLSIVCLLLAASSLAAEAELRTGISFADRTAPASPPDSNRR